MFAEGKLTYSDMKLADISALQCDKMVHLSHLNLLLEVLLKSYFFNSRCVLVFTDTINKIELQPATPTIYLEDMIIHHENASDLFVQFEKLIRLNNERFNVRRYIIIGTDALKVFDTKQLEYVSNLVVVLPNLDDTESFDLITHLYGDEHRSYEQKIIDVWYPDNCSFLYGNDLFPDKLYNQNGRRLKIGTFTYEPYSVVGADNKTFHGTETSLIFEFVKKHNLTPAFTIIGDDLWGDIYDNWTGIGILGSVLNDDVDVGYAAIYTWEEYYNFLDYTKPLTRTGVTCLVPAPLLAAGWLTPLHSFSFEMWIALLLVLISDTIVLSVLLYKNDNRQYLNDSIMTMIQLYLLQSLKIPMNGRLMKYFMALNMVIVLLLSSTYSSGLATVMTVPRYTKAIKTVKDLALSGLPWGAPTDAWLISLRQVEEEDYDTIKNNFVVKNEEDLVAASRLHNFGFSLERLPYGHYAVGPYVRRDVISNYRIMPQDIYWEQCIFVVRKNSILLPLLDDLILRVFEAGLASYWEHRVVSQYMDMSVQRGIKFYQHRVQEHDIVKLKWIHVEGTFAILLIGYAASTITFFIEIANKRPSRAYRLSENN